MVVAADVSARYSIKSNVSHLRQLIDEGCSASQSSEVLIQLCPGNPLQPRTALVEFSCGPSEQQNLHCVTVLVFDPLSGQHQFMTPEQLVQAAHEMGI